MVLSVVKFAFALLLVAAVAISSAAESHDRPGRITWNTALGPGEALRTDMPQAPPKGLTHLDGVAFVGDGENLMFIGKHNPGDPVLMPRELLDGLVISLRAIDSGSAPGVSIDPTESQVINGLRDRDDMNVRYIGGTERTVMGNVLLEADRIMKNLGSGRDNETRKALTSSVPEFKNIFELMELDGKGRYTPWTRFWIEQRKNEVTQSFDRRLALVSSDLHVKPRSQVKRQTVDQKGTLLKTELVDGTDAQTALSAKAFANHMTENLFRPKAPLDFAREFDVYWNLQTYASLVSIAEGMLLAPDDPNHIEADIDLDWLLFDYEVENAETKTTTPSVVESDEVSIPGGWVVRTLKGGVDLTPKNEYGESSWATVLAKRLTPAYVRRKPRQWQETVGDTSYEIVKQRSTVAGMFMRQVDAAAGAVTVARRLGVEDSGILVGEWTLDEPSITAGEIVQFQSAGPEARYMRVRGLDGIEHTLNQVGETTLPGRPTVRSFSMVASEGRRRSLLRFRNEWLYIDGDVRFLSLGGGPIRWELGPDTIIIRFARTADNPILSVQTAETQITYRYDGESLLEKEDASGHGITFEYEGEQLIGLQTWQRRGPKGKKIELGHVSYRRRDDGSLAHIVDDKGHRISYQYDANGDVAAFMANMKPGTSAPRDTGRMVIDGAMPAQEALEATGIYSKGGTLFVGLSPSPSHRRPYELAINGAAVSAPREVNDYLYRIRSDGTPNIDAADLLRSFADLPGVAQAQRVVLFGDPNSVGALSAALRTVLGKPIMSATNPHVAAHNLERKAVESVVGAHVQYSAAGLQPTELDVLNKLININTDTNLILLIGHNGAELSDIVESRSQLFEGKTVVLSTCCYFSYALPSRLVELGAKVIYFLVPQDIGLLAIFNEHLVTAIKDQTLGDERLMEKVTEAVEQTINDPRVKETSTPLKESLRLFDLKIGAIPIPDAWSNVA